MRVREVLVATGLVLGGAALVGFVHPESTSGMAQLRQLGRGFLLYQEDAHGVFPISMVRDPVQWRWNQSIEAPAGLKRDTNPEQRESQRSAWVNSVVPYWPSVDLLAIKGAPVGGNRVKLEDTVKDPWLVGFNMNGLLHTYPQDSIPHPSLVPVIWTGQGRANREGFANTSPILMCDMMLGQEPCGFNPNPNGFATMRANMFLMIGTSETFDGAMVLAMADGSAQRVLPKLNTEPDLKSKGPWSSYTHDGKGMTFMVDKDGYPPMFRPDRQSKSDSDR